MTKIAVKYIGDLRNECTHLQSGEKIYTDAPIDNNGKGEQFSPTDLVANAYLTCMLTIIGIYCEQNKITLNHASGEVEKIMTSNPRRIGELRLTLNLTGNSWDEKQRKKIETAAKNCPVAKSVSPEIITNIEFKY
jgi:uncharacterized OsmC-like protein